MAQYVACGPVAAVRKYVDAGFDHIVVIGVGPDQEGFLGFLEQELALKLRRL